MLSWWHGGTVLLPAVRLATLFFPLDECRSLYTACGGVDPLVHVLARPCAVRGVPLSSTPNIPTVAQRTRAPLPLCKCTLVCKNEEVDPTKKKIRQPFEDFLQLPTCPCTLRLSDASYSLLLL